MGAFGVLIGVLGVSNSRLLAVIMLCPILETTFDYFCEIFLKKLIVLLLVSFVTTFAGAANWVESGTNIKKGLYNYVDTESISTQGNYKQAFIKFIDIPKKYYFIALVSYDCKSKPIRTKTTYITKFDLEGSVINPSAMTGAPFYPVLPESMGEGEVDIVCNF